MTQPAALSLLTIEDYLDGEPLSPVRHEYLAGQVYAMAGASETHNRIAGNLFFHLRAATRGTPCGVFISDMKVRVAAHDAFYYPDVLLTCAPEDTAPLYKTAPCLIAEVLSPATAAIDRREKLTAYRTLPSLRHYLLLAQDRRRVELHTRDARGVWNAQAIEDTGWLTLSCGALEVRIALTDLYEDVRLESPPAPEEP